jgi:hypothetical protein
MVASGKKLVHTAAHVLSPHVQFCAPCSPTLPRATHEIRSREIAQEHGWTAIRAAPSPPAKGGGLGMLRYGPAPFHPLLDRLLLQMSRHSAVIDGAAAPEPQDPADIRLMAESRVQRKRPHPASCPAVPQKRRTPAWFTYESQMTMVFLSFWRVNRHHHPEAGPLLFPPFFP